MKKFISMVAAVGFVLALGAAYSQADSLLDTLDPSKVPGFVELETGAATLPASQPFIMERGSAAGGMSIEHDTFLNYIDPSRVAGYVDPETGAVSTGRVTFTAKGSAAGGIGMEHDTFLNYIVPSKERGYVDPDTGAIY